MRQYSSFPIALNEIKRELKEMGILVTTQSVQNIQKPIEAYELQSYQYMVTQPDWNTIPVKSEHRDWCEVEFHERVSGSPLNPGVAWKLRRKYWEPFLNKFGKFDYAYPERMSLNLDKVIHALKKDINTRRAFLPVLDRQIDEADDFSKRFPCTLGYHFLFRQGKLNMTYLLRSSDYFEHLANDLYLANRLQCHVAESVGVEPGYFCHWVGSLHCFVRDVEGVF